MNELQCRLVQPEDHTFLFQLFCSVREQEVSSWGWAEEQLQAFLQLQWSASQASYRMQFPNALHQLILHNQTPIGQFLLHKTNTHVHLVDFSIVPAYRNQGIGTHIIKLLQTDAEQLQLPIILNVMQGNIASRLYERLGFQFTNNEDPLYRRMKWLPRQSA